MFILKPDYYDQFHCIGEKCQNTCCAGWTITIDEKTYARYMKEKGELGEKLKDNIDEKQKCIKLNSEGVCPFLSENKLCEVQSSLGADALSRTCMVYPRTARAVNDFMEMNLQLSCSEVARLVLSSENPISFCQVEDLTEYKEFHNIASGKKYPGALQDIFFQLQSTSIDLLQRKEVSLHNRLLANLLFLQKAQKKIDRNVNREVLEMIEKYSNPDYLGLLFEQLDQIEVDQTLYLDLVYMLLQSDICKQVAVKSRKTQVLYVKYIANMTRDGLKDLLVTYEQEFEQYMQNRNYEYENYYVYMIYDQYMNAIVDKNIFKANVMIQVGFTLIKMLGLLTWVDQKKELSVEDHALIVSLYAKGYLHSNGCYEDTYRLLSSAKYNQLSYQAALIKTGL